VGRKPEPFILACLFLTVDSILLGLGKQQAKVFGKKQKAAVCQHFSIPCRTVELRQDELAQFFVNESKGSLPWPIDKRNLLAHLKDIANVMEKVGRSAETSSDPPSFKASQEHRETMSKRISEAEKRLCGFSEAAEGLDETDLAIEQLLLKKVSKEDIVCCSNPGQLYSLLALQEPIVDSDVE
jgi:hypothetical protein